MSGPEKYIPWGTIAMGAVAYLLIDGGHTIAHLWGGEGLFENNALDAYGKTLAEVGGKDAVISMQHEIDKFNLGRNAYLTNNPGGDEKILDYYAKLGKVDGAGFRFTSGGLLALVASFSAVQHTYRLARYGKDRW